MLMATVAGVFVIPILYYVVQTVSEKLGGKKGEAPETRPAPEPTG